MKNVKKHLGWFVLGALVMVCLGFTIVEGLRVRTPGSVGQPGIGKVLMATTSEGDVAWTNQIVLAAATGISLHPNGQTITISNSASAGGAGSTNFQGARILKTTSSQSIPANTATLVTFNTVVYDTDSMTASANQLTMPRDGYYRITAQLYWNGSGSGTSNFLRMLYIRVGGSVGKDIGAEVNYQVDNELCMQNASAVIYMLQSDPVTIMATHSRSAAEFLLTDPTLDGCFLEAEYLGSDVAAGGSSGPTTNAPPYTVPITGTNFILDWLALGPTNDLILTNYAPAGVLHTNLVRGKRLIARIDQGGQGFCTLVANTNHFGPNNRFTAIITGITQSTNGGYQDFFGWYGSGTNAVAMANNWGAAP